MHTCRPPWNPASCCATGCADWDALAERHFKAHGKRQGVPSESVNGIISIKALALETQRFGQWNATTDTVIATAHQLSDHARHFSITAQTVMRTVNLIVLALGCWRSRCWQGG